MIKFNIGIVIKILTTLSIVWLVFFTGLIIWLSFTNTLPYHPTHHKPVFKILVETLPSDLVDQKCRELSTDGYPDNAIIQGCARYSLKTSVCHVVLPEPTADSDMNMNSRLSTLDTWGHELLHCVKGAFHD